MPRQPKKKTTEKKTVTTVWSAPITALTCGPVLSVATRQ